MFNLSNLSNLNIYNNRIIFVEESNYLKLKKILYLNFKSLTVDLSIKL